MLEGSIWRLAKESNVVSFMVPQSPEKFSSLLRQGKLILLGACTDPGMNQTEGFLKEWYLQPILDEVEVILNRKLVVYKFPYTIKREFVLISLEDCKELLEECLLV